ncbi:MAG: alpha/beta fold hydrolase [Desulfomonilia bacterium]|jgi:pimeloyl-ACP methyl ester carboxylesterase|uniref:2-hydroxy-6-oxo-6-(2'-aminophenyl)hexa-2, 4-dienoic acid hydrolase n=1 Tax=anaerobic digester metagenome TaxID=1263854 RepID=A0A485MCU0_9ZZZZ|nr:alpha/beta fold hydrolase [Deltaproteobacteria bacterium]HPD20959.1 alpha/beta fold hydrolase [Deltaproteobacteria bacterium]HPX17463.1 alpha/beta fold hydrolase [Deltaproteobacteria bacterium]HRS55858.1 alpha/beta fold hydrolase [Desulfomonilia bacterium]HRV34563.1 alpha/beta fold hydrolase [Desulfomonilia bacterium]
MEIEEHKVHVEEVPIRYLSVGSGPALLLLHGIGDSISDWKPVMRELSDAWSIFAPEMPFATGWGDGRDYTPEHLSRFVLSFLRAVRVARCVAVGHSAGGMAAIGLALEKPELVRALVLVASSGLGQEINPAMVAEAAPLWGDLAIGLAQTPVGSLQRALFRSQLLFSRPGLVPRQWWAEQYRLSLEPAFLQAVLDAQRASTGPLGQKIILLEHLPGLKMPVLLIWGTLDQVVPVFQAEDALDYLKDGSLAVIAGSGHMPHLEQPAACAEAITRFAAEHIRA